LFNQRRVSWSSDEAGLYAYCETKRSEMTLGTVLLIVLVLALLGVIPSWPHSRGWGYGPSGGIGLVLLIVLILFLLGKI
jgi:drug/metabolite transporter superfamily protein YnfA